MAKALSLNTPDARTKFIVGDNCSIQEYHFADSTEKATLFLISAIPSPPKTYRTEKLETRYDENGVASMTNQVVPEKPLTEIDVIMRIDEYVDVNGLVKRDDIEQRLRNLEARAMPPETDDRKLPAAGQTVATAVAQGITDRLAVLEARQTVTKGEMDTRMKEYLVAHGFVQVSNVERRLADLEARIDFTAIDRQKLFAIETGAEINVQADWNQTSPDADDFIRNKPDVDRRLAGLDAQLRTTKIELANIKGEAK